MKQMLTDKG